MHQPSTAALPAWLPASRELDVHTVLGPSGGYEPLTDEERAWLAEAAAAARELAEELAIR